MASSQEIQIVDEKSPNLLTLPMTTRVAEAADRINWKDETWKTPESVAVSQLAHDIHKISELAKDASPSMQHAYEHVASEKVRSLSDTAAKAVESGQASYASEEDKKILTNPLQAQADAGLQRREPGAALAQPIFSNEQNEKSAKYLGNMTEHLYGKMHEVDFEPIGKAMAKLTLSVDGRTESPAAAKTYEERTPEEQRTVASYNAIATEAVLESAVQMHKHKEDLIPTDQRLIEAMIYGAAKRSAQAIEREEKPEGLQHATARHQIAAAAMAAAGIQR